VDLDQERTDDLLLAVTEMAANSVRHGGGHGVMRAWQENGTLLFELRDRGHVTDPLVGRRRPDVDALHGRGVYLAHQVCDLMQLRSDEDGTVVRLHMRVA
jgi:anti-sigma regulatory factor (Ser/Thr protein kinase)